MRNSKGQFVSEYNHSEDKFYEVSKEKFYFIGLLCADGNVNKSNLNLSQSGIYGKLLLKRFRLFMESNNPIKKAKRYSIKHNFMYVINITISNDLLKYLGKLGLTENKTETLSVSEFILNDEFSFKWFLRGFVDGDGTVFCTTRNKKIKRKNGDVYECIEDYMVISFCTNDEFSEILNNYIEKYSGVIGKVRKRNNNHSEIIFRYGKSKILGKWLYENYKPLEWRKSKKCREYLKSKNLI